MQAIVKFKYFRMILISNSVFIGKFRQSPPPYQGHKRSYRQRKLAESTLHSPIILLFIKTIRILQPQFRRYELTIMRNKYIFTVITLIIMALVQGCLGISVPDVPVRNDSEPKDTIPAEPVPADIEYTDLSARGYANCYIVPDKGYYSFKALTLGPVNYVDTLSGDPVSAKVLWETFGTLEKPEVGSVIRDVAIDTSDVVTFYATGHNGNAVIAVLDSEDNILWSWHIWCCMGFDPMATAIPFEDDGSSWIIMDRNLGATGTQPGSVEALGLLYQHGRKDPFLGAGSTTENIVAESSATWPEGILPDISVKRYKSSELAAIPMTFIKWDYTLNGKVRYVQWADWTQLKGKSDPCPIGWRVAYHSKGSIWDVVCPSSGFGEMEDSWNGDWKGADLRLSMGSDTVCWFPATGYYDMNQQLQNVGTEGRIWTGLQRDRSDLAEVCKMKNPKLTMTTINMANACAVRCCRDEQYDLIWPELYGQK